MSEPRRRILWMWTTSILLPNFNKSVDYIYRWIFVSRVLVAVVFAECFLVSRRLRRVRRIGCIAEGSQLVVFAECLLVSRRERRVRRGQVASPLLRLRRVFFCLTQTPQNSQNVLHRRRLAGCRLRRVFTCLTQRAQSSQRASRFALAGGFTECFLSHSAEFAE